MKTRFIKWTRHPAAWFEKTLKAAARRFHKKIRRRRFEARVGGIF